MSVFKSALRASMPVAFGYFPLGIAFGVLLAELDYPWFVAFLMGFFVYAGAAQFFVLSLLRAHAPLYDFAVMALFLNIRHVFYGLSFLDRYRPLNFHNVYLAATLTDETYSILTTGHTDTERTPRFYFYVSALNHTYWTVSCAFGGIAGQFGCLKIPELEFALPCLLIVLATEQLRARKRFDLAAASLFACLIGVMGTGKAALFAAIALSCIYLLVEGRHLKWRIPL